MASSRDRQRKLARAKLDRQMARRAAAARRKRRIRAGVGAGLALLLIAGGSAWALGAFEGEPETPEAAGICTWTPQDTAANSNLTDVGMPETTDPPHRGVQPMTITTNQGEPITVELDLAAAPCAAANFAHLASRNFFDDTTCHEITDEGAILCGDPTGTGQGGPTYSYFSENVPVSPQLDPSADPTEALADHPPLYPAGTVAAVGVPQGTNGSQFKIFFEDYTTEFPSYPIIGKVTSGMETVEAIGALPLVNNAAGAQVKPETDVVIQSLTVGEPIGADETEATPSTDPSTSAPATTDPSATEPDAEGTDGTAGQS
ncbi:peptidylprolyl isomerase [Solwaraspora sp. WMMD792]|uniref:peptidylprolyl isomerase n=1 Tax=Solwaraspora sp. WMMD792 TaxID=3016099 RepID=UPI002415F18D|nr:peptidylprolyl isomerase [Solwaraspora sp. WMMD792]MDG4770477.1 peptidylprolyl isomerase [Solwaraspora sp. WMMD792]